MTLRDDIRNYFDREAGRFPTPQGFRSALTAEAARVGGVKRRTTQWAAAVAAVLAVAIVAGLLAAGSALRHQHTAPVIPGPPPTAKPGGARVLAVAPANTGWALLQSCSGGRCQYSVSITTDGGGSWSKHVDVGPSFASTDGDAPRSIHFLNPADGFVYGHSVAYVTHDGGVTWADAGLHAGEVVAIDGHYRPGWAVIRPCAKGTTCEYKVLVSADQGRSWNAAAPLPSGFVPRDVVAFQPDGLLLSGYGVGNMLLTSDGGASWHQIPGRCAPQTLANYITTANGRELWQMCSAANSASAESLYVSADGGTNWARRAVVAGTDSPVSLWASGPGRAVVASPKSPVEFTTNGGRSWTQAQPIVHGITALAPYTGGGGWALDIQGVIWATEDGGADWARLPAQP